MSSSKVAIVALCALATRAHADKAAADVAFNEAKRLRDAGQIAEACPKFELSQHEDPQLGTLLSVADCHEQLGKVATAWAEFREAIDVARSKGDQREAYALERSEKVAPRVPHVTLVKQGTADVHVTIDGRDTTALIGVAIPIDPGAHAIATRVGTGAETRSSITVAERRELTITVPIAKPVAAAKSRTRKLAAIGTAGGGLVLAGVGLYFGKRAFDQYDDSHKYCDAMNHCDPKGQDLIDSANSSALTADILVGVGVAAVVTGAVLWFTAPKEHAAPTVSVRPVVTPTGVGGALSITF